MKVVITVEEIKNNLLNLGIINFTDDDLKNILSLLNDYNGCIDKLKSRCPDNGKNITVKKLIKCLKKLCEEMNQDLDASIKIGLDDWLTDNDAPTPPTTVPTQKNK